MIDVLERPPRTIMEVYKTLPEGTLAELINGVIYMSPSPIRSHQQIIMRLSSAMFKFIEENDLGELNVAPFDVYLDEQRNAVQPDIIYVGKENLSIIKDHIHGVPDLLIEILSEGNKNHDLKTKKDLYETFGVKEYWVIDPTTKEAMGYFLNAGKYAGAVNAVGRIDSKILDHSFEF